MQTFIQNWKQLPFKNHIYLSFGLSLFVTLLILALKNYLPPEIPLFYGKSTGPEQLTSKFSLMIAPGVAILITTINTILSFLVNDIFIKKTLVISSVFISLLSSITVIKIIMLVGFF